MGALASKNFHNKNTTDVVALNQAHPFMDSQQLLAGSGSLQMFWESLQSSQLFHGFPCCWTSLLYDFALCLPASSSSSYNLLFFWISSGHLFRAHLSTKEDLTLRSLT